MGRLSSVLVISIYFIEIIIFSNISRFSIKLRNVQINNYTLQAIADLEKDEKVYAVVRTEDVTFSLNQMSTSARNNFNGPVVKMNPVGTLVRIEIDCGFPLVGVVTAKTVAEMGIENGTLLYASFKATAIHVIHRRD